MSFAAELGKECRILNSMLPMTASASVVSAVSNENVDSVTHGNSYEERRPTIFSLE